MSVSAEASRRWTLLVHGGAGSMRRGALSADQEAAATEGLRRALEAGAAVLEDGGSALDATERAVMVLEDDPSFNAGRGSVLSWDGRVSCDAAIMDGRTRSAGAVAGIGGARNPVSLARAVMERSAHVLLVGADADSFSRHVGAEQAPTDWFETVERRRQLEELRALGAKAFDSDMKYGTVGAVAVDRDGHVAAATSTGGLTAKRWGRVGDSPILGAGTLADDRAVAISCTGSGEAFIRMSFAHELSARIRLSGETVQVASAKLLEELAGFGGKGGFIAVSPTGDAWWSFNTPGMYRGRATEDGDIEVAVYAD